MSNDMELKSLTRREVGAPFNKKLSTASVITAARFQEILYSMPHQFWSNSTRPHQRGDNKIDVEPPQETILFRKIITAEICIYL
jgi:hypothetical protein